MQIEYLITVFIICLSPGIGVLYTLSATLAGGIRAGFWAALGCTLATLIHLLIAMAGLAAILYSSSLLFQSIKFAGVLYLLWMAWVVFKDRRSLVLHAPLQVSAGHLLWRGMLLNLLNPKLPLFFVAFIPQFVPTGSHLSLLVELGLVFTLVTFVVFMGYVFCLVGGREKLLQSQRAMDWIRRAFASSFVALGLKLAFEGRS